jgi:hypothetical protein
VTRWPNGGLKGRSIALWAVGVAVAAASLQTSACGPSESEPRVVRLVELVAEQESYEGSYVQIRGTVRAFGDAPAERHYVVEDTRANRVQLLPGSAAQGHVGHEVIVVGRFDFDEAIGRSIRIETISKVE